MPRSCHCLMEYWRVGDSRTNLSVKVFVLMFLAVCGCQGVRDDRSSEDRDAGVATPQVVYRDFVSGKNVVLPDAAALSFLAVLGSPATTSTPAEDVEPIPLAPLGQFIVSEQGRAKRVIEYHGSYITSREYDQDIVVLNTRAHPLFDMWFDRLREREWFADASIFAPETE